MSRTIGLLAAGALLLAASPAEALRHSRGLLAPGASAEPSLSSRAALYQGMFATARFTTARLAGAAPLTPPPPPPPTDDAPPVEPAPGGEVPLPDPVEPPSASLDQRAELQAEFAQLEKDNPSLAVPITTASLGIGALYLTYFAFLASMFANSPMVSALLIFGLAASVALVTVGTILIVKTIIAKVQRMRRMNQIEDQLRYPEPAPAPYAPMQTAFAPVAAPVVLARF